jgi:hypothetical protein
MAPRNLLVLLLESGAQPQLRRAIAQREDGSRSIRVVAPTRVGALEWLATDEDDARAEAEVRALEAEWLLADRGDVEATAGDVDPVQAVEDALRSFPAEEILLVAEPDEDGGLERSLRRFGLPVTWLGARPPAGERHLVQEAARGLAAGRSKATPFVAFAGVNLFLLLLAAVISLVALLVVWLI